MDADKPGREGDAREESGRREGAGGTPGNRFETFGPVTSLEPDGTEPIGEAGEVRERLTVSVTWESVSVKPRQPEPGTDADRESAGEERPAAETARPEADSPRRGGKPRSARRGRAAGQPRGPGRSKERLLDSIRGESPEEDRHAKPGKAARAEEARASGPQGEGKPPADWTHAMAGNHDPGREDAESIFLLDDSFLRKTFKEVNFPASKELVLRYVDQEQDFAWGHDRTVNLHNLITHLDEDGFRTRRDLLHAIKERLGAHPAGRPHG